MAAKLEGSRMETVQKQRRAIFYNNLILLEFNEGYMERKHKIPFNKDMFAVPNKKGFEVITHFLFSKLNETIGEEEYKILFPVLDKSHAEEFRRTCYTHLNKISQKGDAGMPFPQILPSIFLSPGGEKFYELYLAFSVYVMQKFIEKDRIVRLNYLPPVISANQKILPTLFQLQTNASVNRFVEIQKAALNNQQELEDKANKLTAMYRNIKKKLRESEILLQEKIKQLSSGGINTEDSMAIQDFVQDLMEKNKEPIEKIKTSWSVIEDILAKEKELWEIVRTELSTENAKKYVLDGKDYKLQLPYLDTTKCYSELEKRKLHSVYKDGKLCLTSFIDMWMVCMEHYMKLFSQGKVSKLSPSAECSMKEALDTVSKNLNVTKTLIERITSGLLPLMKENVQNLQSSAYSKLSVTCQDTKWINDMLFLETPQTMEQLSIDESKKTQSDLLSEACAIPLDDSFPVVSSSDHTILSCEQLPLLQQVDVPPDEENLSSPTCRQSLFPLQADMFTSQEEASSPQLSKKRLSFSSVTDDISTVKESSSEKQDLLNLIISPLKEDSDKMDSPKTADDNNMCSSDIFGWLSQGTKNLILSPTEDSLNEEDLLDTTLPQVPFFDGNTPLHSPM